MQRGSLGYHCEGGGQAAFELPWSRACVKGGFLSGRGFVNDNRGGYWKRGGVSLLLCLRQLMLG